MTHQASVAKEVPDLHFGNIAPFVAKRLFVPGVIVLVLNEDGTIGISANGVNHAKANEMLSVGIHLNLTQHYELVRQGAAGQQAAEHIKELDGFQRKEIVQ